MRKIKRRERPKEKTTTKKLILRKTLRKLLISINDNIPFKVIPAGHEIAKNWARFDYHITDKGNKEYIARITVMTTYPTKTDYVKKQSPKPLPSAGKKFSIKSLRTKRKIRRRDK